MNLIKTSLLNAIAVGTKLVTSLILNKVLAIYLGPTGYGLIGQFMNFLNLVNMLASLASNTGVTKYTAEYQGDETRQSAVWRTAASSSFAATSILSILLLAFHQELSVWLFKQQNLGSVLIWLAGSLFFFVVNSLFLSVLNGKREVSDYVKITISSSLTGTILVALFAHNWGLEGALGAMMLNQVVTFSVVLFQCSRNSWFKLSNFFGKVDPADIKKLGRFSLMAVTSAIAAPVTEMVVRNHVATNFGWDAVGFWQAVVKISDMYLMFITTTLSLYFLPRFAEIKDAGELKRELWRGYVVIIPFVVFCSGLIYILRDIVIALLFTHEFSSMRDLFGWQLMADVVKIIGWVIGFLMLSRGMTKYYVVSELFFSMSLVVLVRISSDWLGLEGVVFGYFANYTAYLVFSACILRIVLRDISIPENRAN